MYVRLGDHRQVDFAAPNLLRFYRDTLDLYRGLDLDGVGWDEPGCMNDWTSYRYGDNFRTYFQTRHGYDIRPELWRLDDPEPDARSLRVRLDYYDALNESLYAAQRDFIGHAAKVFGKPMLTGTHHTWHGEGSGNDYRVGAVDYFRLGDGLDAGYTDCSWWDAKSVAYSYLLGSSLGRLTPSGECECNTWHFKPTVENTEYNARLMSLLDITWFNIWYGPADTCSYPGHYTWKTCTRAMRAHRDFQRALDGARPEVDTAVLHDWTAVCALNSETVAHLHKAFFLNFSLAALHANLPADFIDARLLADAKVENGRLVCALGAYRRLVVPFAVVIDRKAWGHLRALARSGGEILFAGPPPERDTDGQPLALEFATWLALDRVPSFAGYHRWFAQNHGPLPDGRPEHYDAVFPLAGDRVESDAEGRPAIVADPSGRVRWFTGYEPHRAVIDRLRRDNPDDGKAPVGNALWRWYRRADGRRLLALVAPEGETLRVGLRAGNRRLRIMNGTRLLLDADGAVLEGDAVPAED